MMDEEKINQEVYVTPNLPLSRHLRNAILRRIWLGEYPVGHMLPSVRDLAKEFGINRNTVNKVYKELTREGFLVTIPGKGSVVARRDNAPISENGLISSKKAIYQRVDELIQEARASGIDRHELLNILDKSINNYYDRQGLRLAFVECSVRDTIELSRDIHLATSVMVEPVNLSDLKSNPTESLNFDLIITTFYHIREVEEILASLNAKIEVIAIQINPIPSVLLELARLSPGTKVGIVSKNNRTMHGLYNILHMYNTNVEVNSVVLEDNRRELEEVIQWSEVILDSQSVEDVVLKERSRKRIITVHFQIDSQSLVYIRNKLIEIIKNQSNGVSIWENLVIQQLLRSELNQNTI